MRHTGKPQAGVKTILISPFPLRVEMHKWSNTPTKQKDEILILYFDCCVQNSMNFICNNVQNIGKLYSITY